ncbi:MAG: Maf family protein [Chitinispirillaceae bacterium]|nr:Maf family protein [Chitinispirillaceae bacterium]
MQATWQRIDRKLILASNSPRRRDILKRMGFEFEVMPGNIKNEEEFLDSNDIYNSVKKLALLKGKEISERFPEAVVLSADTVVWMDNKIFGKPESREEAKKVLGILSGRNHKVITAVALSCKKDGFIEVQTETTEVKFRKLEIDEIEWYLNRNGYKDKAGGYGIQEGAMIFVEKIDGCFFNVMGLPVAVTIELFKGFTLRKDFSHDRS